MQFKWQNFFKHIVLPSSNFFRKMFREKPPEATIRHYRGMRLYSRKSSETVRNMATLPEPNTPAVCQRHTARQQKFLGKSFIWCVFLCTQISLRCFTTEFLYYTYLKELFYTLVLRFHHRMLQASQVSLRKPEYLGAFWCKQHTLQHNKLNFRVYLCSSWRNKLKLGSNMASFDSTEFNSKYCTWAFQLV